MTTVPALVINGRREGGLAVEWWSQQRRRVSIKPSTLCPPSAPFHQRRHEHGPTCAHTHTRPPLSCQLPLVPLFVSQPPHFHSFSCPSSPLHTLTELRAILSFLKLPSTLRCFICLLRSPALFWARRVITPKHCLALKNHVCLPPVNSCSCSVFFVFFFHENILILNILTP